MIGLCLVYDTVVFGVSYRGVWCMILLCLVYAAVVSGGGVWL